MAKPFEDFGLGPEENREFGFSQEGIFYLPVKRYSDSADAERHMAEEFETVAGDWEWRVIGEVFLSPDEPTGEVYWIESDPIRITRSGYGAWSMSGSDSSAPKVSRKSIPTSFP